MGSRTSKLQFPGPTARPHKTQKFNILFDEKEKAKEVKHKVLDNIKEIGLAGPGVELRNGGAAFYMPLDYNGTTTSQMIKVLPKNAPKHHRPQSRNYSKLCDFDSSEKMIMADISRNDALRDKGRCGRKYERKLADVRNRKLRQEEERRIKTAKKMEQDFENFKLNQTMMEIEVLGKRQKEQEKRNRAAQVREISDIMLKMHIEK